MRNRSIAVRIVAVNFYRQQISGYQSSHSGTFYSKFSTVCFQVYETRTEVAIVLELCAGGELQRLLDEEERLSEGAARRALRHVLEGLAHLHARRIAHLDLKPQNLLLTAGGEELLICDFGISRAIQPGAHVREILGTRDYVGEYSLVKWHKISKSNFILDLDKVGQLERMKSSSY